MLNSERDPFFHQIRWLTITGASNALRRIAQDYDQFVENAKNLKDVNEKAAAVKKIKVEEVQIKRRKKYYILDVALKSLINEEMKSIGFHK